MRVLTLAFVLLVAGCDNPVAPVRFEGAYSLASWNGSPLPTVFTDRGFVHRGTLVFSKDGRWKMSLAHEPGESALLIGFLAGDHTQRGDSIRLDHLVSGDSYTAVVAGDSLFVSRNDHFSAWVRK